MTNTNNTAALVSITFKGALRRAEEAYISAIVAGGARSVRVSKSAIRSSGYADDAPSGVADVTHITGDHEPWFLGEDSEGKCCWSFDGVELVIFA